MNNPSPRIDYLSRLPNELLEQIYEENYRDWNWEQKTPEWSHPKTLIAPLSKRLLDVQHRQLYKSIDLVGSRSLYSLARLLETISNRPELGTFVQSFTIYVDYRPLTDEGEQRIRDRLAQGGLRTFFSLLPKLKSVKVWGRTAGGLGGLVEALGSDNLSPTCTYLSLFLPIDCLNRVHFLSSHLQRLRLSGYNSSPDDKQLLTPHPLHVPIPTFPFTNLSRLVVYNPRNDFSTWTSFIARCPGLTDVELWGNSDQTSYSSLIEAIPVAAPVTSLIISVYNFLDDSDPDSLGAINISRLSSLRTLEFVGQGDYSLTLLSALHNPHLEKIAVRYVWGAFVSSPALVEFVSSLPPHHSLRHIDLDVGPCSTGRRAAEIDFDELCGNCSLAKSSVTTATIEGLNGWRPIRFPRGLHAEQLVQLRQVGLKKGVECGGTASVAMELQEEYRKEVIEFERMWNEWKVANPR